MSVKNKPLPKHQMPASFKPVSFINLPSSRVHTGKNSMNWSVHSTIFTPSKSICIFLRASTFWPSKWCSLVLTEVSVRVRWGDAFWVVRGRSVEEMADRTSRTPESIHHSHPHHLSPSNRYTCDWEEICYVPSKYWSYRLIVLWRHGWILKDEKNLRKCRM